MVVRPATAASSWRNKTDAAIVFVDRSMTDDPPCTAASAGATLNGRHTRVLVRSATARLDQLDLAPVDGARAGRPRPRGHSTMAEPAFPEEQRRSGSQAGALPVRGEGSGPPGPYGPADDWLRDPPAQHPFVFQHKLQLFLLDGGAGDWLLAELWFERALCRYVE